MNSLPIELRHAAGVSATGMAIAAQMPYGEVAMIDGRYHERIEPTALHWRPGHVLLNEMHRRERLLAREGKGMSLTSTDAALVVSATLPDTTLGRDVMANLDVGLYDGISVEMRVEKDTIERHTDGKPLRVVHRAELVGIAIADRPIYRETAIDKRIAATECLDPDFIRRLPLLPVDGGQF